MLTITEIITKYDALEAKVQECETTVDKEIEKIAEMQKRLDELMKMVEMA